MFLNFFFCFLYKYHLSYQKEVTISVLRHNTIILSLWQKSLLFLPLILANTVLHRSKALGICSSTDVQRRCLKAETLGIVMVFGPVSKFVKSLLLLKMDIKICQKNISTTSSVIPPESTFGKNLQSSDP